MNLEELEQEVWKQNHILIRNFAATSFNNTVTTPTKGQLQVFEVLVAETLARFNPHYKWEVTKVQGDEGIDFKGIVPGKVFNGINLDMPETYIAGQVKRNANLKDHSANIVTILHNIHKGDIRKHLNAILIVLSTKDEERIKKFKEVLDGDDIEKFFYGVKEVVGGLEFVKQWALNRSWVLDLLQDCFVDEPGCLATLDEYLRLVAPQTTAAIDIKTTPFENVLAGQRFPKKITISSNMNLPSTSLIIRWKPADNTGRVQLVCPVLGAKDEGFKVKVLSKDGITLNWMFRTFAIGEISLGSIEILNDNTEVISSAALGTANVLHSFTLPYYSEPNRKIEGDLELLINSTRCGGVESAGIIGVGGSGKSRVCEKILDRADALGIRWMSASHVTNKLDEHSLFKALIYTLCRGDSTVPCPFDTILNSFEYINRLSPSVKATLVDINDPKHHQLPDSQQLSNAIFALLVIYLEQGPCVIHLSDLHWGTLNEFEVLNNLLADLSRNQEFLPAGIFFMFEGRSKESLEIDGNYISPEDWFRFIKSADIKCHQIQPWKEIESKGFVEQRLFSPITTDNGTVDPQFMPLNQELIEHILDKATGNPFHLTEQLKLLLNKGMVSLHETNGLLYVSKRFDIDYDIPKTIKELILKRIEYFRDKYSRFTDMFTFIAKLGKQIPMALFNHVVNHTIGKQGIDLLRQMDMANFPDEHQPWFSFQHENYYSALKEQMLENAESFVIPALKWYEEQLICNDEQLLQQVTLHLMLDKKNYQIIYQLINSGLNESIAQSNEHITEQLLRIQLQLPREVLNSYNHSQAKINHKLGETLIKIGDWEEARMFFQKVRHLEGSESSHPDYWYTRLDAHAQLANVAIDMQEPYEAIKEVNKALQLFSHLPKSRFDLAKLQANKEFLWDNKAVALLFNGQLRESMDWEQKSFDSTITEKSKNHSSTAYRQMGTFMLHFKPLEGREMLRKALQQSKPADDLEQTQISIIKSQLLMADLLCETLKPTKTNLLVIDAIFERCLELHNIPLLERGRYDAAILGLVCGAACGVLHEYEDAEYWFKYVIRIAIQSSLYDILWKAWLNLAQVYYHLKQPEFVAVNVHEAEKLILKAINNLPPNYQEHRMALMILPLSHILRLAPDTAFNPLPDEAPHFLPEIKSQCEQRLADWQNRPVFVASKDLSDQQVLHARDQNDDYFMMN